MLSEAPSGVKRGAAGGGWADRSGVVATGTLPTSIGTPPQLSIYTFALKVARAMEVPR